VCSKGINVLTGKTDVPLMMKVKKSNVWPPNAQQNYMVVPEQRWLGDLNAGDGQMVQFTPTLLGDEAAAEAQMDGTSPCDLQISAFPLLKDNASVHFTTSMHETKHDLFGTPADAGLRDGDTVFLRSPSLPGSHPATLADHGIGAHSVLTLEFVPPSPPQAGPAPPAAPQLMTGFSCGGRITDKIYPDLMHGPEKWDVDVEASAVVHMVNSRVFVTSTGRPMPETTIRERDYKILGLPAAYDQAWEEEPDGCGLHSKEVSEIMSERQAMFQSRSCLVEYELRN